MFLSCPLRHRFILATAPFSEPAQLMQSRCLEQIPSTAQTKRSMSTSMHLARPSGGHQIQGQWCSNPISPNSSRCQLASVLSRRDQADLHNASCASFPCTNVPMKDTALSGHSMPREEEGDVSPLLWLSELVDWARTSNTEDMPLHVHSRNACEPVRFPFLTAFV